MSLGAVLYRDDTVETVQYADRFEGVRHRGLRQAFQALNPGLLVCHPETFQVRYANAAAREILDIEDRRYPRRLPELLTMTRQEEFSETERRPVACYRTEIDNDTHDVRAFPVYTAAGQVDSVLVVMRDYQDVSWSLFEMLDRLPIAIAAVTGEVSDVRYINRMALCEIYGLRTHSRSRRALPARGDRLIEDTLAGYLAHMPDNGEGQAEIMVGRTKTDMHFARLGANDGARLLYWDPRGLGPTRH